MVVIEQFLRFDSDFCCWHAFWNFLNYCRHRQFPHITWEHECFLSSCIGRRIYHKSIRLVIDLFADWWLVHEQEMMSPLLQHWNIFKGMKHIILSCVNIVNVILFRTTELKCVVWLWGYNASTDIIFHLRRTQTEPFNSHQVIQLCDLHCILLWDMIIMVESLSGVLDGTAKWHI